MRASIRVALRIFFTAALAIAITIALFAPILAHCPRSVRATVTATHSWALLPDPNPADDTGPGDSSDPEVSGQTDFYGNDVSDAVARYKLDATGSLYEQHSPETELPHPASPKS